MRVGGQAGWTDGEKSSVLREDERGCVGFPEDEPIAKSYERVTGESLGARTSQEHMDMYMCCSVSCSLYRNASYYVCT